MGDTGWVAAAPEQPGRDPAAAHPPGGHGAPESPRPFKGRETLQGPSPSALWWTWWDLLPELPLGKELPQAVPPAPAYPSGTSWRGLPCDPLDWLRPPFLRPQAQTQLPRGQRARPTPPLWNVLKPQQKPAWKGNGQQLPAHGERAMPGALPCISEAPPSPCPRGPGASLLKAALPVRVPWGQQGTGPVRGRKREQLGDGRRLAALTTVSGGDPGLTDLQRFRTGPVSQVQKLRQEAVSGLPVAARARAGSACTPLLALCHRPRPEAFPSLWLSGRLPSPPQGVLHSARGSPSGASVTIDKCPGAAPHSWHSSPCIPGTMERVAGGARAPEARRTDPCPPGSWAPPSFTPVQMLLRGSRGPGRGGAVTLLCFWKLLQVPSSFKGLGAG